MVTAAFIGNFACRKYEGYIGEAVEQEVKLCDEVKTHRELSHLCDRVSTGGGCENAANAITRCGWVRPRECGESLYGKRFNE